MKQQILDIDIGYSERGRGDPVVLLHGLAEDRCSFANVQQRLTDFHTYALDLRGHGESSMGDADGSLQQLGEDLIGFLEEITGPAACIGYSLGGTVVLWAAIQRPDLINNVVVAGTSTVVGSAAADFFQQRIEMLNNDFAGFCAALGDDTAAQIINPDVDVHKVLQRRIEAIGDGAGYINAARAMIGVHKDPLTPELESIRCPVHVIGMDQDFFCPRKAADIMLDSLKHGIYRELSNAGHLVSVDQPAAYAAALSEALISSEKAR